MGNKLILLPFLLFLFFQTASAQCPPSNDPNLHVVQKGETFYGISRAYDLSLDELYALNGLNQNAVLKVCQTLRIKKAAPEPEVVEETILEEIKEEPVVQETKPVKEEKPAIQIEVTKAENVKPFDEYIRQKGKTHIVQPGEKLPLIARLYGYTEAYFREFNRLGPDVKATPGMVLKSTHCECPTDDIPVFEDTPPPAPKSAPATEQEPEPVSEMEDPILEEETEDVELDQPDMTIEEAPSEEDIAPMEQAEPDDLPPAIEEEEEEEADEEMTEIAEGGLAIEDTKPEAAPQEKEVMEAPKPILRQLEDTRPKPKADPRTKEDEMRESAIVIEINNLRTNPVGYADILSNYLIKEQGSIDGTSLEEANALVEELRKMGPLTPLRPDDCLFKVAQTHGLDEKTRGFAEHIGSDGSWPWDRVTKTCGNFKDGSENLLSEVVDPRAAILKMLVDADNTYRPNRKNLLREDWRSIGVFKIGNVGGVDNHWVITFGK
ncbi:MAG: LysM peptidoglycan-binding domain-containing protein [Saprospiraceae bacterium]|nr:LysM peptidoglycan-binding domain-containing protein [Saprospiraceae bacterium]